MSKKKEQMTEEMYTKEDKDIIKNKINTIDKNISKDGRYRWFIFLSDNNIVKQISCSNYPKQAEKEARDYLENQKESLLGQFIIECKFIKYDTYKDIFNLELGVFEIVATKYKIYEYPLRNDKDPKYTLSDQTGLDKCGINRMAYYPKHIDKFKEAHFKKFSYTMLKNKYRGQVMKPYHYSSDIRFE